LAPTAEYKGKFSEFSAGAPKTIVRELALHGVTKPVTLGINSFKFSITHAQEGSLRRRRWRKSSAGA
jgi:polyisoprenoid-binding protein YceI